jgi:hypothetical protein
VKKLNKKAIGSILLISMLVGILSVFNVLVASAADVWDGTSDTSWYTSNPTAKSFNISSSAQLAGLASIVTGGTDLFKDDVITLTADIDLNNIAWKPIGADKATASNHFYGTFDGNGHVIKNLHGTSSAFGLFGYLCGTIKNLGIENLNYIDSETGWTRAGSFARALGRGNDYSESGTIESCYATNVNFKCTYSADDFSPMIGGLVGVLSSGTINNCYVRGVSFDMAVNKIHRNGLATTYLAKNPIQITNTYVVELNNQADGFVNRDYSSGYSDMTVTKCYTTEVSEHGFLRKADEIKGYASTLGDAFAEDSNSINNGYPILKWQSTRKPEQETEPKIEPKTEKYSINDFKINKTNDSFNASAKFSNYDSEEDGTTVIVVIAIYKKTGLDVELIKSNAASEVIQKDASKELNVSIDIPDDYSKDSYFVKAFFMDGCRDNDKDYESAVLTD